MDHCGKSALRRAMLLATAGLAVLPLPALAQDTSDEEEEIRTWQGDGMRTDVIVVQGTKDAAFTVAEYPGSVSAIDAAGLEARAFQDISSLSYAAPNVGLDTVGTFKGVANFSIRGVGVNSSIPSIDPAVGLFVDGVYMGLNAGSVFDALDVEQVNILRGPQGVSFGRNTTGGAVMVNTANPTDYWTGYARLGWEGPVDGGRGGGMWTARGVVSGPLSDTVSIRLGALRSDDQGYFINSFDGGKYSEAETIVLRGAVKSDLGERLMLLAKVEYTDGEGEGSPAHNNGLFARDTFQISVNERGFHDSENLFATLRADYELGAGTLTNIFGWRDYQLLTRNDIDSSPDPIFASDTATTQEQWSNELSYAVETGPVRLVTGGYVFHQNIAYDEQRDLSFFGAAPQYGGGKQSHDVYGLFGQVDFDVADYFAIKAGLRWSREEKDAEVTYVRTRPACSVIAGTCPVTGERVAGENNGFADTRSWENLSPRVVATLRPNDQSLGFVSWARGYRSGGYNFRITQPDAFEEVTAALGSPAFDQERADTFEAGVKWNSENRDIMLSGAVFQTDVNDLQREVVVPSITSGLAQSIYNTADAKIKGLELEGAFEPVMGLSLTANLGLINADYSAVFFDLSGDGVINADDLALDLPRAPKATWGGSVTYDARVSDSKTLTASVFFQHRNRNAYSDNNWGFNYASDRLDASVMLECDCGVSLTVFGRNLLDDVQFGADAGLPFAGGPFSDGDDAAYDPNPNQGTFSPINKGRTVGVELGYRY